MSDSQRGRGLRPATPRRVASESGRVAWSCQTERALECSLEIIGRRNTNSGRCADVSLFAGIERELVQRYFIQDVAPYCLGIVSGPATDLLQMKTITPGGTEPEKPRGGSGRSGEQQEKRKRRRPEQKVS